jgi:hypothetical protein
MRGLKHSLAMLSMYWDMKTEPTPAGQLLQESCGCHWKPTAGTVGTTAGSARKQVGGLRRADLLPAQIASKTPSCPMFVTHLKPTVRAEEHPVAASLLENP